MVLPKYSAFLKEYFAETYFAAKASANPGNMFLLYAHLAKHSSLVKIY